MSTKEAICIVYRVNESIAIVIIILMLYAHSTKSHC